jgi:Microcystin-dependent protein|nr:MAG TPA: tail collar fiber protein [Caudoviricetes sp.]
MPYQGNVWKDGPDGRTPITAAKLTKMEDGITAATTSAEHATQVANDTFDSLSAVNRSYNSIVDAIVPVGAVLPFYGSRPPKNWLLCYGQEVSRTEYKALFDTIGTVAGSGNGSTTFNVPDLKGKVIYGQGSTDALVTGSTVGETHHTLTVNEMPSHGHDIVDSNNQNSNWRAGKANTDIGWNDASGNGYTYAMSTGTTVADRRPYAKNVGGGQPFPIRPRGSVASMIIRAK